MPKLDEKLIEKIKTALIAGVSSSEVALAQDVSNSAVYLIKKRLREAGALGAGDGTGAAAETEPGSAEPLRFNGEDCYKAEVYIPISRLDWVLGNVTLDEAIAVLLSLDDPAKANAIEFLINRRFEQLLESPASADPIALWRTTPEGGRVAFAPPDLTAAQPTETGDAHV
jgi:hypothetical protein